MTAWLELDPSGWLRADQVVCVVPADGVVSRCWVYGADGSKWPVAHPAATVVGWLAGVQVQTVYPPVTGLSDTPR